MGKKHIRMTLSIPKVARHEYSHAIRNLFPKSIKMKDHRISRVVSRMSRVIQVGASLENSEINQYNIHHIFVLALLDHLVFYGLSFGSR